MKSIQDNMFINSHESNGILIKLEKAFTGNPNAKWVILTRNEYRRLQVMQGLLLIILLSLSGVMLE